MILFFRSQNQSIVAVEAAEQLNNESVNKLSWLFGNATYLDNSSLEGYYVGPRREMITPWSTNAVEITQNMGINNIVRIEEYFPVSNSDASYDPMLQRLYNKLDQQLFTIDIKPQPILFIDDLEAYNEQEGLALSEEEMSYLKKVEKELGRSLTDSEVFGFAQINSEHCRHKIFGGTFIIDGKEMESSLFAMIKKTTKENPHRIISAYKDNVAFADGPIVEQFAPTDHSTSDFFIIRDIHTVISLKAETHNFPTTVEPFNGASTGTGGEIRDRMGGGKGSWPIAGTAVYMTSYPRNNDDDKAAGTCKNVEPRPWLYQTPEQILIKASNGASDFGNKFGQPLIAGSVLTFEHQEDPSEPLYAYDKVIMLAGGVGYGTRRDCLKGTPEKGNQIVVVGGDNYRIGLGGGSVSSVDTGRYASGIELNAVQRANAEMQKRAYNVVRSLCEEEVNPIVSIHDHGSAGHVNCLSELVEECGGKIEMKELPIGDKTLSSKEIIANESQERMGLLIQEESLDHVRRIAERERAPLYVVGETTGDARFVFEQEDGIRPFDLAVSQMFGSSPKTIMEDSTIVHQYADATYSTTPTEDELTQYVTDVLQLESVGCKDWLTNKVDRSVTGKIARQQCQGPLQLPLSDCGVTALDYRGRYGIATALGHAPQAGLADPAKGSVLAVAESLTNIVWAQLSEGLDSVSLSANWMWPCRSQEGEDARLYTAVQSLSDFCCALEINVPTGKDSLSLTQKYPDGRKVIGPGTVIVSAGGEVSDVRKTVSPVMIHQPKSAFYHIDFSFDNLQLGGSAFFQSMGKIGKEVPTVQNPEYFRDAFNAIQQLVRQKMLLAGHDISAGGLITTLLEMCFANTRDGMVITLDGMTDNDITRLLFAENPGVVVQVSDDKAVAFRTLLDEAGIGYLKIGHPSNERTVTIHKNHHSYRFDINALRDIWFRPSWRLERRQAFNGMADERRSNIMFQPISFKFKESFTGKLSQYGLNADRWKEGQAITSKKNGRPKAAIIREKGTNGEREMAYSLWLAGFDVKDVTMTDLVSGRETLDDIRMIVFCGGFSNSDVLGSAKGWAGAFLFNPCAKEALDRFYARKDTLSLGICNGCQLMMELGLIGEIAPMRHNTSHKFESAFVGINIPKNNSIMFSSLEGTSTGVWVAHGEGRFDLPHPEGHYNIIARYNYSAYPGNPNGSIYDIAGIASADGRHVAMMPHPERCIFPWQCGTYPTDRLSDDITPWMEAFNNAYRWCLEN